MKFSKYYTYSMVGEWRDKYLDYKWFKRYLQGAAASSRLNPPVPESEPTNSCVLTESLLPEHADGTTLDVKEFFELLEQELAKINRFVAEKEQEAEAWQLILRERLNTVTLYGNGGDSVAPVSRRQGLILRLKKLDQRNALMKKRKLVQTSLAEHYHSLELLLNYATLNYMAFYKVLKKFNKLTRHRYEEAQQSFMSRIASEHFYTSPRTHRLKTNVECLYAEIYAQGERREAKRMLRRRPQRYTDTDMFLLGNFIGVLACLVLVVIVLFVSAPVHDPTESRENWYAVFPVFRSFGLPLLAFWLYGTNVWVWTKNRINYVYIFSYDLHTRLTHQQIFKTAGLLTTLWLICVTLYLCSNFYGLSFLGIPQQYYPLVSILIEMVVMLMPFGIFHRATRFSLAMTIWQVVISPFGRLGFREFWVGDILTSLVRVFYDVEYTICYYVSGDWMPEETDACHVTQSIALPFLAGLPLLWRMLQCLRKYRETNQRFPHLVNAGKYVCGFTAVSIGALHGYWVSPTGGRWHITRILWVLVAVGATLYQYIWDVTMDWGLIRKHSRHRFLRDRLLYPWRWTYYWAIVTNFFGRFAWTLTITPNLKQNLGFSTPYFNLAIATVELARRFQWSFFRVEYEQVANSEGYRSLPDVPLLYVSDEEEEGDLSEWGLKEQNPLNITISDDVMVQTHTAI